MLCPRSYTSKDGFCGCNSNRYLQIWRGALRWRESSSSIGNISRHLSSMLRIPHVLLSRVTESERYCYNRCERQSGATVSYDATNSWYRLAQRPVARGIRYAQNGMNCHSWHALERTCSKVVLDWKAALARLSKNWICPWTNKAGTSSWTLIDRRTSVESG